MRLLDIDDFPALPGRDNAHARFIVVFRIVIDQHVL